MDFSTKQPLTSIFYIEANTVSYYSSVGNILIRLDFPPDVISHLEVINTKKLGALLQEFIASHKIPASSCIMILSPSIIFEKDFNIATNQDAAEIGSFLELVPFEEVFFRTYKLKTQLKVIAVNKTYVEILRKTLLSSHITALAIIP